MNIFKLTCFGIFISLILYGWLLSFAFTQDDFFILRQARFNSSLEQFTTSLPRPDSIYFRPLGIQGYFWLVWRIFGQYPSMYRVVSLIVHSINATLVYLLAKKTIKNNAWIVWLFYLTAPLHFTAIGWIGNISFLSGTFWILLTLLVALRPNASRKVLVCTFVLGLLTNELVAVTPWLLVILSFFVDTRIRRKRILDLAVLCIVDAVYVLFRFMTPHAASGPYEMGFGSYIFQNIRWLLIWTVGWAEPVKDYFTNVWHIRSEFVQTFPVETGIQSLTTLTLLIVALREIYNKKFWLGILFFIVSVLPVLFFRQHISPHYAMVGSMGIFLVIALGLDKLPKIVTSAVTILWLLQVVAVMRVHAITHWWVQHALLSESLQQELLTRYPTLPLSKQVDIVSKQPERAKVVLSEDNAVQLIYNDQAAKATYLQEP